MSSLKDIAARTGLSINTVSRAIRRSGYVSEKSQKLIEKAVRELNYQPNRAAQSLRSSRSYEIAVINIVYEPSSVCDSMNMDKTFGINEYLSTKNYESSMHYMYSSPEYATDSKRLFDNILRQKPAGIIFLNEDDMAMKLYDNAEESGIPAILVSYAGNLKYDSVYVDRKQGVYDAVKYLIEKKRRNIVFAAYVSDKNIQDQRLVGYEAAVSDFGIQSRVTETGKVLNSDHVNNILENGQHAAEKILEDYPESDAVIAYSDYLASVIATGMQKRGITIPDDIALIGFDNRELAMFCSPPLTTIAQPNRELGRSVAEALLGKISSKDGSKIKINVRMEMAIRESA